MKLKLVGLFVVALLVIVSCSQEKNTFVNRVYHQTTSRYNGLYNANELLYTAMKNFQENKEEDLFEIIPVNLLPNEEEVMSLYPAIDTAIAKCKKVISMHAMPSAEKMAKKREEHNKVIDDNFITIGRAMYYRRDFDESIKNFEFVRKFFNTDPSNYTATLWIARNQLQIGELSKAKVNLDKLEDAMAQTEAMKETPKGGSADIEKQKKKKTSARYRKMMKQREKNQKAKEEKKGIAFVEFPKKLIFDLHLTKGEYFIAKGEYEEAIKSLESAAKKAKKKDRGRVYFILGQLYEKMDNPAKASENYNLVLKNNTPFALNFAAKMNRAVNSGGDKAKGQLIKMSKDAKNFEYRDQIFYALGELEYRSGNKEAAFANYNKSTFYNVKNERQKGRTYERMADISYQDKEYVKAQKYYDSCSKVIKETYPRYKDILKKANKLQKLVTSIEIAETEDSLQRIAKLSPDEQIKFAENLIKKMKEDEERKRLLALEKQKELTVTGAVTSGFGGGKNYFSNQKVKSKGFEDFRKQWGYRDNEDNWRRSNKLDFQDFAMNEEEDSTAIAAADDKKQQASGPTPESLLANLPTTDSALAVSNARLVAARYDAGIIYKEQLGEQTLAATEFQKILDKKFESEYNPMASFQLYRIYIESNGSLANVQKDYILANYPESDYASYLKDPDFFIKKKKLEQVYEQEYLRYLDRYNRGLYYAVIGKADIVIDEEPDNQYRSKYMLMKAMCLGQMNDDKSSLIPVLEKVKAEYPDTPEASRAEEMLGIIKNGYSKNVVSNEPKSTFTYSEKGDFWIIIVPDKETEKKLFNFKSKVSNFNDRFYSKQQLKTETKLLGQQNVVTADAMDLATAKGYIAKFKASKNIVGDASTDAQIFFISKENLPILLMNPDIEKYLEFFNDKY